MHSLQIILCRCKNVNKGIHIEYENIYPNPYSNKTQTKPIWFESELLGHGPTLVWPIIFH